MVLPILRKEHTRNLPAAAWTEGDPLQSPVNMTGSDAHIDHNKFRLTKHMPVDALEDEVLFLFGIQGHQEGIIDIAPSKFPDIYDLDQWLELFCSGDKIVQGIAS